jgi:hypothetical protein
MGCPQKLNPGLNIKAVHMQTILTNESKPKDRQIFHLTMKEELNKKIN